MLKGGSPVGKKLISNSKGRILFYPILDGNRVKDMPGLIPASSPGSFKKWIEIKNR